jgi:hypothetical protein
VSVTIKNLFFIEYPITFSDFDTTGTDSAVDPNVSSSSNSNKSLNRSSSNPDLSACNGSINDEHNSTFVVKVYRSDQSFKYFPVLKVREKKSIKLSSKIFFHFLGYNSSTSCYVSYN